MKIAMVSYYLPSQSKIGVGWAAHRLANSLVKLGISVEMFSPSPKPDSAKYSHTQYVIRGKFQSLRWPWLLRGIDFQKYDAVICHGDDFLMKKLRDTVHIRVLHGSCFYEALHIRGIRERTRMLFLGITELISAIRFEKVIGVSRNSIRLFPWLTEVIPNPIELELFKDKHGEQKEEKPTILFVGTYRNRKRGKKLMEIFENEIKDVIPDVQLWMVCSDAPKAEKVLVTGQIDDLELASLYRKAWVLCQLSTYEGFGIPYIEAMASNLPIVTTSNPGAIEILKDGRYGEIVKVAEVGKSLVKYLNSGPKDPFRAGEIESHVEQFDSSRVAGKFVDLIKMSK